MIKGIGLDITLISRMEKKVDSRNFMDRVFSKEEQKYINSKGNHRAQTAAGIFCAKESFLKALGKGICDLPLNTIEILHKQSGAPYINYNCDGKIFLSITHMGDIAAAQVIIESEDK